MGPVHRRGFDCSVTQAPPGEQIGVNAGGDHLFQIPETKDLSYQYMAVDGWSFGEVNNNEKEFTKYVEAEGLKYNNPPVVKVFQYEKKGK